MATFHRHQLHASQLKEEVSAGRITHGLIPPVHFEQIPLIRGWMNGETSGSTLYLGTLKFERDRETERQEIETQKIDK